MSLIGSNNEEKIWNYLYDRIGNAYGTSGLIGNLFAESGLKPNNLQNTGNKSLGMTDEEYTAAVDNGTYTKEQFVNDGIGYSLAQWTWWSRKKAYYEYVKSKNKSIGDLETSLDFLYKELSESYKSVLSILNNATSILQASNAVLTGFEKPRDQGVAVQQKRAGYGQTYYDKFASKADKVINKTGVNELRAKVVSVAEQYIGCKESDGSHRKIIDVYNSYLPLARNYKVTYTDAWCATFVSAISILCGLTDIMPTECGCGAMIQLYQKLGRWVEKDDYIPNLGDLIMYDWNDSGSGDCVGYPEHVGIIVSVNNNVIKVIEGNYNNVVNYRTLSVNDKFIRGYCIPNYESKSNKVVSTQQTTTTLNKTVKWTGFVTAKELNVRTWAGIENKLVSFSPLKQNKEVGVCDSLKDSDGAIWYYIKYNNKYGFVSSKYIQKKVEATSNNGVDYAKSYLKAIVGTYKTTADLNLRTGAGTDKKVQCIIPKNEEVTCYGYYTVTGGVKWYLVVYKTYTGFVSSRYLNK